MNKIILIEQLNILAEWNIKNADEEPEQVRKNVETISRIYADVISRLA